MTRSRALPYLVIVPLVVLALSRWLTHDAWLPLVWASSVTPLLYLPSFPLLVFAAVKKRAPLGAAALFVAASHLVWVLPSLVSDDPPATEVDAPRLRVVTANLLAVNPAPGCLMEELLAMHADVLVLQEVSPRWAAELDQVSDYPHRLVEVSEDAFGIAVLSRRPLRSAEVRDLRGVPMIDARVTHQGELVRVLAVHTLPPISPTYAEVWRSQLRALVTEVRAAEGPLVLAGDLNGTTHHAGFEALVEAGMRDVHESVGRGLRTTWPNGVFLLPSLRLDHVLVSPHLQAVRVWEGEGAGSDHQPVVADLVLRPDMT